MLGLICRVTTYNDPISLCLLAKLHMAQHWCHLEGHSSPPINICYSSRCTRTVYLPCDRKLWWALNEIIRWALVPPFTRQVGLKLFPSHRPALLSQSPLTAPASLPFFGYIGNPPLDFLTSRSTTKSNVIKRIRAVQ